VTLIPATGPSAEDIRKVIAEYGAREARRTAVAEKKKEDEDKDKEKKDEKKDESKSMLGSIASAAVGAASSAASAAVSSFTAKDEKKSPTSSKPSSPAPGSPSTPPMAGVPSVPAQTHKKYALHRTFFEARKATHISRQNTARAKEVSKGELRLSCTADSRHAPGSARVLEHCHSCTYERGLYSNTSEVWCGAMV